MEKKINCKLLERKPESGNVTFVIKSVKDDVTYSVRNCDLVHSDEEAVKMGYKCYNGNVELKSNGSSRDVSACLWVRDVDCVLVYNE